MPDTNIERTIYKLELDGSDYITAVDKLAASTEKFTQAQGTANKKISESEQALKDLAARADKLQQSSGGGKIQVTPPVVGASADEPAKIEKSIQAYGRLRQLKNKIAEISIAGGRGSEEFENLNKQAIQLQSAIRNTNKELALSAGNVSGIAALKEGVRGVVGAFEAAAGAIALFGGDTEEAEKATKAVIGAMGILNGIEEVTALLSKNSALSFYLQGLAHKAAAEGATEQAIAETGLTVAEGEQVVVTEIATVAQTGLNAAMLANPVGALAIALLALLAIYEAYIHTIGKASAAEIEMQKKQELLNEAVKNSGSAFAKASENVNELKINVDLAKQGFIDKKKVVEEYNESIGKTAGAVKTLDEVEQKLNEHGDAYIEMTLLKAAANYALEKAAKVSFEAEEIRRKKEDVLISDVTLTTDAVTEKQIAAANRAEKKKQANAARNRRDQAFIEKQAEANSIVETAKQLQEEAAKISKEHKFNFFGTKDPKEKKELEDDFEKRRADFVSQISALAESEFESEVNVRAKFKDKLDKALLDIGKDKSITSGEDAKLRALAVQLNTAELDKALADVRKKRIDAEQKINDEIATLNIQAAAARIALIQNDFERERQTIEEDSALTTDKLKQERDKQIKDIQDEALKTEFPPGYVAGKIAEINSAYSSVLDSLEATKNQRLQKLSFDTFEKLSEDANRLLDSGNLGISQGSNLNIKKQTELYLAGKISYEKYQKELTKIARFETQERYRLEKLFLDSEIKIREEKLANDKSLTEGQITTLNDEIVKLKQQLTDAGKSNDESNAGNKNADADERIKKIVAYSEAMGQLADSVIGFWQKANEAEAKALDRSIALQEKRVTAAQRIADRGNAQYLKEEEDRLTELNLKRENAARKQLGIDAALQASQILVGITGAVAKIATPGIGIAETIGAIAVIIGSLATGYSLVKSLQGNQPKLAKGDLYVRRNGNPSGVDTIPAWLNEGEAVTSAQKNKAYHPTMKAIHAGTIPPEQLNNFVNTYHRIKPVPQPNYEGIKQAAELHIGQDGRMAVLLTEQNRKLDENNDLQRQTLRAMKNMAVSANIDRDGVAIMVNEFMTQMEIDKKI